MIYPITRKSDVAEEKFGITIADPYRWLEDDNSEETMAWVDQQQALTESILNQYPGRKDFLKRLQELNDYPKQTVPIKRGEWYYYYKNEGLQNQYVCYRKRKDSPEELFFDPNSLSEDGTTSAHEIGRNKEESLAAFMISPAGSDAGEIWIMDVETKTFLAEKLLNMRHTGVSWYGNGFFYSRYDQDQDYQEQDKNQKIYYHKLGDPLSNDQLIYEDKQNPLLYHGAVVSDDQKTLFVYVNKGTSGTAILYKDLTTPNSDFKVLFEGFDYEAYHQDAYENGYVYLITNKGAKNYRMLKVSLANPDETNWQEIIPERDYLLDGAYLIGGKIIALFTKDVQAHIEVLDTEGNFLYPVTMPYQGTANLSFYRKEDVEAYFYFSSFVRPAESYHYDVVENTLTFYHRNPIKADVTDLESKQIFYPSKDGTMIPMTLVYRKGIVLDGNNPLFLYGYGGFNISLMPEFSVNRMALIEKGVICAVVNLRGGGEYGEAWHEGGMLRNKQNVFDDFIAAAEYLIKEKYTSPAKIAINGGSNGGLLVGACLTQRPDLFKVAVPTMGVMDMLRFHKFTCGWGWIADYGNPEEEIHFKNLLSYSPIHNVKDETQYPATMICTADHDDRVIPGHSFKFAATLQEHADQDLPLLLYTQRQSSHHSSSMSKGLEQTADIYSFICLYLQID